MSTGTIILIVVVVGLGVIILALVVALVRYRRMRKATVTNADMQELGEVNNEGLQHIPGLHLYCNNSNDFDALVFSLLLTVFVRVTSLFFVSNVSYSFRGSHDATILSHCFNCLC